MGCRLPRRVTAARSSAARRRPLGDLHPALSERPRLVQHDRVDLGQTLHGLVGLDEDAGAGGAAGRDGERERCRHAERARARHDEKRRHVLRASRPEREQPHRRRHRGEREHGEHEDAPETVRPEHDWRAARVARRDEREQLPDARRLARRRRRARAAATIDSSCPPRRARPRRRPRAAPRPSARRGPAGSRPTHDAVDGQDLAGRHVDDVAHADRRRGRRPRPCRPPRRGGRRRDEREQALGRLAGQTSAAELEPARREQSSDKDGDRVEPDLAAPRDGCATRSGAQPTAMPSAMGVSRCRCRTLRARTAARADAHARWKNGAPRVDDGRDGEREAEPARRRAEWVARA